MNTESNNEEIVLKGPDELAGALQEMRRRAGVSHRELARRVGTARSVVDRWLSGSTRPHAASLHLLADVMDHEVVIRPKSRS